MNTESVLGIVRHVATFGGGLLVSYGYLTPEQATSDANLIVTTLGGILTLAGVAASLLNKFHHRKALAAASAANNGGSK